MIMPLDHVTVVVLDVAEAQDFFVLLGLLKRSPLWSQPTCSPALTPS